MKKNFNVEHEKEGICPVCEDERKIEVGARKQIITIKKEPIEVEARVERCTECGEFFAGVEHDEETIQKAYREYRKRHDLLQPEEIKAIREQYGLGQRAFSRTLGWGEITIHRYEAGSLQDEAHNDTLFLVRDANNFAQLFEKNKEKLPNRTAHRAREQILALQEEKQGEYLHAFLENQFMKARNDIQSGFRLFDLDRFETAILFFCNDLENVFKTKLNKLLWYFDFLSFKRQLRSATGAVYIHLPLGPVPDEYDFFLANLIREHALEPIEVIFDEEKGIAGEIYKALEEPELELFNEVEQECLHWVGSYLGEMGAREISDLSHNEDGYKNTANGEIISYEWAEKIKLAAE